jgi:bile acid:Na+ symporter, BASS family
MPIDQITLRFDQGSLLVLNVILGLVMFGVALDLKIDDFKRVAKEPKGPLIGLVAQFFLLPAFTYLLTRLLSPPPSVALGMILIAACPGGNLSNFIAHLAKGRTVLSISMTAVSTTAAIFMTPFNVTFWGRLNPDTAPILKNISLKPFEMFLTVGLILVLPLALGMFVGAKKPHWALKMRKPFKIFSLFSFFIFIVVAFHNNLDHFTAHVGKVFLPVLLQNAMALALGYFSAKLLKLRTDEARAVSIEVGIQNSALGLILIFNFFEGLGGMAIIAAWYGIWHIVAGLSLAGFWLKFVPLPDDIESAAESSAESA